MKKIILLLIIIGILLTACSGNKNLDNSQSFLNGNSQSVTQNAQKIFQMIHISDFDYKSFIDSFPNLSILSHEYIESISSPISGFEDDKIIYLNKSYKHNYPYHNVLITVSQYHDNKFALGDLQEGFYDGYGQLLVPETVLENYINTRERIFYLDSQTYNILGSDLFDTSSTDYELLKDRIIVRTNADWNVTPWKIKYTNYCKGTQQCPEEYISYCKDALIEHNSQTTTPAVINESWEFDYEGRHYSLVNFGNFYIREKQPVGIVGIDKDIIIAPDFLIGEDFLNRYPVVTGEEYEIANSDLLYRISALFCDNKLVWEEKMIYPNNMNFELNKENETDEWIYIAQNSNRKTILYKTKCDYFDRRELLLYSVEKQPSLCAVLNPYNNDIPVLYFNENGYLSWDQLIGYILNNDTLDNCFWYAPGYAKMARFPLAFVLN